MGQHFADKLRDIANQKSENDEALIQRINSMFDRYVPELKEQIPEGIQNDLIESAKKRGGKSFIEKLTNEIIDASNGQGAACKKREDTHKMAEANKAFAHYRY